MRAASDCETHLFAAKSFFDKVVEVFNPFRLSFGMGRLHCPGLCECAPSAWDVTSTLGSLVLTGRAGAINTEHVPDHHHLLRRQRWLHLKLSVLYFMRKLGPACVFLAPSNRPIGLSVRPPSWCVAFCGRNPCHGSLSCNRFRGSWMCTTALILLSISKLWPLLDDVPTTSEVFHRLYVAAAQYLTHGDRPLSPSAMK